SPRLRVVRCREVLPADQRISCAAGNSVRRWSVAIAVSLTVPNVRFDLASREADVPQHVVIESLKLRDGALHDPFLGATADDARERLAISPHQAGVRGCREQNVDD